MIPARYHDGRTAHAHDVFLSFERLGDSGTLVVHHATSRAILARLPSTALYELPARKGQLRLGANGAVDGARVVVEGERDIGRIRTTMPVLGQRRRFETGRQIRLIGLATLALTSVILAYIYGVPLLAARLVQIVPPGWEEAIGDIAAGQMETTLAGEGGLQLCDADPDSAANRAIARFGNAVLADTGSPFTLDIRVVRSDIPNAFALPGGHVYFHSSLLNAAETQDEFAGVLAHEIGHVAHRHGMEQLISTAGTGALIGFILGDLTGISVAGGIGATMIDARFSRAAELEADRFAADAAQRHDFDPAGLTSLIARVGEDDAYSRALALLSTHPLTEDRRIALEQLAGDRPTGLQRPFSAHEWASIKLMCSGPASPAPKTKSK